MTAFLHQAAPSGPLGCIQMYGPRDHEICVTGVTAISRERANLFNSPENRVPISFDLNEIEDRQIKQAVEGVMREWIGDRAGEDWKIRIESRAEYYRVWVKGPGPVRRRFFFEDPEALPQAIRSWLELYPP